MNLFPKKEKEMLTDGSLAVYCTVKQLGLLDWNKK